MNLVILGAPGAGKGTQAQVMSKKLDVPHISTGDIFRENIRNSTVLGKKVKEYTDKGALVPDEVTVDIIKDRLNQSDCAKGFILDGFPRNIAQAEYLERFLSQKGTTLDKVLYLLVPDDVIIYRMSGRRVCSRCGKSYNINSNPTKQESICDACGGAVIQRVDDNEETIANRLKTFYKETEPLVEYYKKQGQLSIIQGRQSIEETLEDMLNVLGVNKK